MSEPPNLPYASAAPSANDDAGHLKAIVIGHYVWGGLAMLLSCMFIFHIVMGLMIVHGRFPMFPFQSQLAGQNPFPNQNPFPPQMGYMFVCMGSGAMLLGWSVGILTILSGRAIARRRWRIFSLVMAGVNCAWFPFGTVLGVFTFIVLLRQSVRARYPDFTV